MRPIPVLPLWSGSPEARVTKLTEVSRRRWRVVPATTVKCCRVASVVPDSWMFVI
jgi:hypothetical protein